MAQVYLADMLHTDDTSLRLVALKLIHPHLAQDQNFLRKFEFEARLGGRLIHENIVQLLDFDNSSDRPFLVMEYVEGATLDRIIAFCRRSRKALPLPTIAALLDHLLRGLDFAHALNDPISGKPLHVLHRDLKPSNILINHRGVAKITDFGIARAADRPFETDAGVLQGTASYMAPEQLKGRKDQGPPLDLWSVGVILYEMLRLEPLFQGSLAEVISKIVLEDVRPRLMALSGVPPELRAILTRLLNPEPEQRYQSARDARTDLKPLRKELGSDSWDWDELFEELEAGGDTETNMPVETGGQMKRVQLGTLPGMDDSLRDQAPTQADVPLPGRAADRGPAAAFDLAQASPRAQLRARALAASPTDDQISAPTDVFALPSPDVRRQQRLNSTPERLDRVSDDGIHPARPHTGFTTDFKEAVVLDAIQTHQPRAGTSNIAPWDRAEGTVRRERTRPVSPTAPTDEPLFGELEMPLSSSPSQDVTVMRFLEPESTENDEVPTTIKPMPRREKEVYSPPRPVHFEPEPPAAMEPAEAPSSRGAWYAVAAAAVLATLGGSAYVYSLSIAPTPPPRVFAAVTPMPIPVDNDGPTLEPQDAAPRPKTARRSTTPALPMGERQAQAQAPGSEPAPAAPHEAPAGAPASVPAAEAAPEVAPARLNIKMRPGGTILLNGKAVDSPALNDYPVPPGHYTIQLEPSLRVHQPVSFDVDLKPGQVLVRHYDFNARDWILKQ
jgi:serine/threonine protein kinase